MVIVLKTRRETGNLRESVLLTPISELLAEMDLTRIETLLHEHLNYAESRKWEYPPILLFKLLIIKVYRKVSYRRLIYSLTPEDCAGLGIQESEPGIFLIPSASTVHDFAYNRLGLDGLNKIMKLNGSIVCQSIRNGNGMIDSSPVEAARYDKYAKFNPYYGCKMYKMHIFHLNEIPLFEIFSEGNEHDAPYAIPLVEKIIPMVPDLKCLQLDAGYDSFMIHATLWKIFRIYPLIDQSSNAVINYEGTEKRINHWVNKLWKKGGNPHDLINRKLDFLFDNGRAEQVGMYIRNQNILNPNFKNLYKSRGDCERTHSHMKHTFNFSVKWIQNRSKEFYVALNFIAYQTLLIARLLNQEPDIQDLSKYY